MIEADAVFGAGFGLVACAAVRAGRGAGCAAVLGGALDTVRAAGAGVTCGVGVGATAGAAATAGISFGFAASLLPSQFCRAWMAEGFSRLGLLVNRSSAVWAIAAAVMASSANAKNTRLIVPVPFTPRAILHARPAAATRGHGACPCRRTGIHPGRFREQAFAGRCGKVLTVLAFVLKSAARDPSRALRKSYWIQALVCASECGGRTETTGMTIRLHRGDLPDLKRYSGTVAIDTETMGLDPRRDRLCVVQLSPGDGSADVVQIPPGGGASAPNLKALLADPGRLKIFHFARFDIAMLFNALGVMPTPVYCTKIASRIARTYTDKHGLKDLVREVLGVDLSKQQQLSDWGAPTLTDAQLAYAASDVLHLHALKEKLDAILVREGRAELAAACFRFLPDRVRLDLAGWAAEDIFAHS